MLNLQKTITSDATAETTSDTNTHIRDLETVANVGAAITTILGLEELLQTVVDLVKNSFNLYHAHVYLVDESGKNLVLTAGAGEIGWTLKLLNHSIAIDNPASLVARCARTRSAVLIDDVTTTPDFLPNLLLPQTRSELAIPMVIAERLIGVLDLQSDETHRFTEADARIQTMLASQIAVAVRNAQVFEERQTLQEETELLYQVSSLLALAQTRQDLLMAVSEYAFRQGCVGATLLYMDLDEDGMPEWAEVAAESRMDGRALTAGTRFHLPEMPFTKIWLASPNVPQLIEDSETSPVLDDIVRSIFKSQEVRSIALLPLNLQGRWVGLVSLSWREPHAFAVRDHRIYSALAHQLAAVVDAIRSKEAATIAKRETEERAAELETVAQVATAAASILNIDELLQKCVDLTKERFNLYHAHIYLLDETGENLVLSSGAGEPGTLMKSQRRTIAINNLGSLVARCARSRDGVIVNDVTQAPDFLPNPLLPNTRSEAAVPMIIGERLIGVLDVQSDQVNRFTESDVRVKTTLASQIAVAVQNARAFQEHQELQQETELLYQVSDRLTRAHSRQDLLAAVSEYSLSQGGIGATLFFMDLNGQGEPEWLELVAELSLHEGRFPVGSRFRLTDYPVANLWLSSPGTPMLIGDTQDPAVVDEAARKVYAYVGQMAVVVMPLYLQGHWVGLVQCQWNAPREFTEKDQRIYTALASQLTAVVDAIRSNEAMEVAQRETAQRAAELETVAKVGAAAATILDVDVLLQTVADLVKANFRLYHAHIYLLDSSGETLTLAAGADEIGRAMKTQGHSIAVEREHSVVARCARTRQGVIINDVSSSPDFWPNALLPNTCSEMAVPMVVGDTVIGVLDVQADAAGRFTDADVRIQTTLGDQIAVAVQNARLYQEQISMVDQLQTLDRLKSEFLASMSHELRTPLNSIIGYSQMILNGLDGEVSAEMYEDVDAIFSGGQHLLHLINDILDLAKIEAGRLEIDQEPVEFTSTVDQVVQMTNVLIQHKPVELVVDIDPQLPQLWADPIRLRQILNNLISNAIKFTNEGEICVKAVSEGNMVRIGVLDTGIGIEPAQVARVFERFHQADSSSARRAGGTGLGLTITRHLIELHGGRIWVESTIGKGTTFWFIIPTVMTLEQA